MLNRMIATIEMDRPIIKDQHYISLGGFEIETNNKKIQFDFMDSYGNISDKSPKCIEIELCNLDIDCFPEAKNITVDMLKNALFTEFFVYTGEDNEPEINPIHIKELAFDFGNTIIVPNAVQRLSIEKLWIIKN